MPCRADLKGCHARPVRRQQVKRRPPKRALLVEEQSDEEKFNTWRWSIEFRMFRQVVKHGGEESSPDLRHIACGRIRTTIVYVERPIPYIDSFRQVLQHGGEDSQPGL